MLASYFNGPRLGEQAPCRVSLGPCVSQLDFGPYAQRQGLLFAKEAVIDPPIAPAAWQNEQMQTIRIRQHVGLGTTLGRLDRNRSQSHEGISI